MVYGVMWPVGGVWDFWGCVGCRGIDGNVCECMGV